MILTQKSDNIGAIASTLCLLHCIATPLIFIVQAGSLSCCGSPPSWWKLIDVLFVIISFFAIYNSTLTSSSKIIKVSLWFFWFFLFFIVIIFVCLFFFFFQAEDGIRDKLVTGVQTCALPISICYS